MRPEGAKQMPPKSQFSVPSYRGPEGCYANKTKPIFQFGALKKDKLSLSPTGKFMPPKGQFGVLSYRGPEGCYANKTKPIFQFGALEEETLLLKKLMCPAGSED